MFHRAEGKFKVDYSNEWMNLLKLLPNIRAIVDQSFIFIILFPTVVHFAALLENREEGNSRRIIIYYLASDSWRNKLHCSLSTTTTTKCLIFIFKALTGEFKHAADCSDGHVLTFQWRRLQLVFLEPFIIFIWLREEMTIQLYVVFQVWFSFCLICTILRKSVKISLPSVDYHSCCFPTPKVKKQCQWLIAFPFCSLFY